MRIIFGGSVILSGLITIVAIWIVHQMTPDFNVNGTYEMWTNGNPALFFIVWPMLFIAYFLFSMIFVLEAIHTKYNVNRRRFLRGCSLLLIALVSYSVYRIVNFNRLAQPYFDEDIGYLNPYSNDLFFNGWTLLAALCLSAIISFYSAGKKAN